MPTVAVSVELSLGLHVPQHVLRNGAIGSGASLADRGRLTELGHLSRIDPLYNAPLSKYLRRSSPKFGRTDIECRMESKRDT